MKLDLRHNRPKLTKLPDGRVRATFLYDVREWVARTNAEISAEVWLAWGTVGPGDYSSLRLVAQELDGLDPQKNTSIPLARVYEEIPASAEVQVGANAISTLEDGRKEVVAEFIQFSTGTYTPGTIGTTTAPGDASAFLRQEEMTDDGTLRRIKRSYVYSGTVSQTDETKSNGKLHLRTIVSVKTPPATPSGYTLVSTSVKNPNGIPIYTYSFAQGAGRISTDVAYKQNGKLKITTIRFLDTDDGTTPAGLLINDDSKEDDGFTLYTQGYAEVVGDGIISNSSETKNGGKLVLYRTVRLGSAPSTPAATIGGTVVSTSSNTRQEDFFTLYDYQWAEGVGEISRDTETRFNGMLQSVNIRYLTAASVSTQPTSDPLSGGTLTNEEKSDQDGFRIWSVTWKKASGTSLITDETDIRNGGKLVIYRRSRFNTTPAAPSATIGGTVVATSADSRLEDGFTIYTSSWAEGVGIISERFNFHDGGLRSSIREILTASASDSIAAYTPTGVVVNQSYDLSDGVVRITLETMQWKDGTDPTAASLTFESKERFTYPGRAKYYSATVGSVSCKDVFLSPPVTSIVTATHTITYSTSNSIGALTNALWNPTEYATMKASFIAWHASPRSIVKGLEGYTAVNSGASGTSGSGYDMSILGERVYAASAWSVELSGGPTSPNGSTTYTLHAEVSPAFVSKDGVQYYRHHLIEATPAAQSALPV